MSPPLLVLIFACVVVLLFWRVAVEAAAPYLPGWADEVIATLGASVSSVRVAWAAGLGAWAAFVTLFALAARDEGSDCEGTLLDGCVGIPAWFVAFGWLIVLAFLLAIAGVGFAARAITRDGEVAAGLGALMFSGGAAVLASFSLLGV